MDSRRFRTRVIPWMAWSIAAVGAGYLYLNSRQTPAIPGYVNPPLYDLSVLKTARLHTLYVSVGTKVHQGQTIGVLDTASIDADIEIARAQLRQVDATIKSASTQAHVLEKRTSRDFEGNVDALELELEQAKSRHAAKAAELGVIDSQVRHNETLLKGNYVTRETLDSLRLKRDPLASELEANTHLVKLIQKQLKSARARSQGISVNMQALTTEPLMAEKHVAQRRLDRLLIERQAATLRAPVSGLVTQVTRRPGSIVPAGSPIVSIVSNDTRRIVACITESATEHPSLGQSVLVARADGQGTAKGLVVAATPGLKLLPRRCQRAAAQPLWGHTFDILLSRKAPWVSGQAVSIRLDNPTPTQEKPGVASAQRSQPTHVGQPLSMRTPASLWRNTRFEPSGLTWDSQHGRYLLVSDDTGFEHKHPHAAWIFSMDPSGALAWPPLSIAGLAKANDLEGIAAHADGTVYIMASQSLNRKGKRSRARQVFARLTATDHGYRVLGHTVALADLLESASSATLSALGSPDLNALDIEGITCIDDGLLIGLKTPRDTAGNHTIWHVPNPDALFNGNGLSKADLRLWGSVKLPRKPDYEPQGISGMHYHKGRLLFSSTSLEAHRGGHLWTVTASAGKLMVATHLRAFPNHRPEGIALEPDTHRARVVFDDHGKSAQWISVPVDRDLAQGRPRTPPSS